MKANTKLSFDEIHNREIERRKPEINRMKRKIEKEKGMLESTEPEFNRLTDLRMYLADDIVDTEKAIQNKYKEAKNAALWKFLQAQPWYARIIKIKPGPQKRFNALRSMRDNTVIEEVKRRGSENPDMPSTAIYEEMGEEARLNKKRCSPRTIRRIIENAGHN